MSNKYGAMDYAHLVELYLNDQEAVKSAVADSGNQTITVELVGCYYETSGVVSVINNVCAHGWDMRWVEPNKVANGGVADKIIIIKDNGRRR